MKERRTIMWECRICGKQLKNYNLISTYSHFNSNKCLKITKDLKEWKDSLSLDIRFGDTRMDTLKRHHDLKVLYDTHVKFKSRTESEIKFALRHRNKTPRQYQYYDPAEVF